MFYGFKEVANLTEKEEEEYPRVIKGEGEVEQYD